MFTMVNLLRLEVSIQGIGIAEAAADKAVRYAEQRLQGGTIEAPPIRIIEHADIRRLLLGMQARIRPLRALIFEVAASLDIVRNAPDADTREAALEFAEFLLPVGKTCAAETAFTVASDAIKIGGGFGYTRDAGIEQPLGDSRIMAIYQGASGIQARDLVSRKLLKNGGARYRRFTARIQHELASAHGTAESAIIDGAASDYLQWVGLVASGWIL